MSQYVKTSLTGICENCGKLVKGLHHLYKCPRCNHAICSNCLKRRIPCMCNENEETSSSEEVFTAQQNDQIGILQEMGFPDYICIHAMKRFNWDINEAIPWIIENLATFPKPEVKEKKKKKEEIEVEEWETEDLNEIEDTMKYQEKKDEENEDYMKKNKKKGRKKIKEEKDSEEWNEEIFDDDLYENGKIFGDPQLEKCYEVIEGDDIIRTIKDICKRESEMLCIDEGIAQLLLKAHEWSPDKLEEVYFDKYEEIIEREHIIMEEKEGEKEGTCSICYDEGELIGLNCGHTFCKDCWKDRVKALMEAIGSDVINCLCMQQGCECRINYKLIEKVGDERVYKRFMYFLSKDFIEHKKSYVFCPVDTCGRAIHYFDISRNEVPIKCSCGQKFCFKCGREMHKPVSCEEFMKWNDLVTNDSENMKFVNTISKPCLHCGLYTERTEGCNHMTCPRCKGEWCWMCRGDWKTHGEKTGGFYKCNLYEKSEAKKLDDQAKQLREENAVFLKYFDEYIKYNNMIRDLTQREHELYEIQRNIEKTTGKVIHELIDAAELCKQAYNVVKYSFVFSYFIKDYEQIHKLFQFRQENDIKTIEQLGEMIRRTKEYGFEEIQKLRQLMQIVKKVNVSLSDVTTEILMKGRYDEAKKKKSNK